jgi:hypothetical protein
MAVGYYDYLAHFLCYITYTLLLKQKIVWAQQSITK